jgi:hypothetical protein
MSTEDVNREALVRCSAWLAAIGRSLDAMHTTKILFNLNDNHCLMSARAQLDKVYDEMANRIEAANGKLIDDAP